MSEGMRSWERSGYEYPPEWRNTTGEVPPQWRDLQYTPIEVWWLDAAGDTENIPLECEIKPLERVTVGYLLKEHEDYLEMPFGFIQNLHKGLWACEGKVAIPKSMIIARRDLA